MNVTLNKIRVSFIFVLLLRFLVACNPNIIQPSMAVSSTPEITITSSQGLSLTVQVPTVIQLGPTPSSSFENPILISYEHDANDSVDYFTACLIGLDTFSFVLYKNGHIVLFEESQFVETTIPQAEIEKLLASIESTGFFLVNGGGDEFTSPPPTSGFVGSSMQIITVKEKTFIVTAGEYRYLVEPIKQTIQIVKEYRPPRLKPYVPDKLKIWVYPVQDVTVTNYDPTPTPPLLEWSHDSLPLDSLVFSLNSPSKSISGEYLQFFMQEVKTVPVFRMVKQNGQHYLIMACPAFQ